MQTQLTFNFSGEINVNITADPKIMNLLNRMFPEPTPEEAIKEPEGPKPPVMEVPKNFTVEVTGTPLTVTYDEETILPLPEEEIKAEAKAEAKVKKSPKKADEPEWTHSINNPKIQWRMEGNTLFVKYYTGVVETTWEKIHQLAKIPEGKRKDAVERVILASPGKWTANKRSAVNIFTELVSTGAIQDTEGTLSRMMSSSVRLSPNSQVAALN